VRCLLEVEDLRATVLLSEDELTDPLEAALQLWSVAHGERANRVKAAMEFKATKGTGMGKPPFGYRVGANKRLEIIPKEAETVHLIYQLYLGQGMGFRLIARHLNEQGITTRKGGRWSIVGIRDILRNRAYMGTYARFGIRVPDSHPAIIPAYLFREVQQRLDARPKTERHVQRSSFLLSGLVYCGSCGNRMTGVSRRETWTRQKDRVKGVGEYRYYQCQSRTNQSVCQYHTRRAGELEDMVIADLKSINSLEALDRWLMQHPTARDRASELRQWQRRLAAVDRRIRGCLEQAGRGVLSPEELRTRGRELVRERQLTSQRLALLEAGERGELTEMERRDLLLERLWHIRERWGEMSVAAKKALLQTVIAGIIVYDNRIETLLWV
jgi:site-specific DNA recombinase